MSISFIICETLKAGEYEIKAGASMREIVELLKSGKSILYSVSVPEGLTVKQVFKRLAEDPVLEGDLPQELPAEGTLMTDTYKFSRGTKRADILQQMLAAQKNLIDQIWEKRDDNLPVATREEFVTLASIVEKETGRADERPGLSHLAPQVQSEPMKEDEDQEQSGEKTRPVRARGDDPHRAGFIEGEGKDLGCAHCMLWELTSSPTASPRARASARTSARWWRGARRRTGPRLLAARKTFRWRPCASSPRPVR